MSFIRYYLMETITQIMCILMSPRVRALSIHFVRRSCNWLVVYTYVHAMQIVGFGGTNTVDPRSVGDCAPTHDLTGVRSSRQWPTRARVHQTSYCSCSQRRRRQRLVLIMMLMPLLVLRLLRIFYSKICFVDPFFCSPERVWSLLVLVRALCIALH